MLDENDDESGHYGDDHDLMLVNLDSKLKRKTSKLFEECHTHKKYIFMYVVRLFTTT